MNIHVAEPLAGLCLGIFVYYQKRLVDFYSSSRFQQLSSLSVSLAAGLSALGEGKVEHGQEWRAGT